MPMLVTEVRGVESRPDGTLVTIGVPDVAFMPRRVRVIRARGRAMIEAGAVDVASHSSGQIADAIRNLSFGQIDRATDVVSDSGDEVEILVRV